MKKPELSIIMPCYNESKNLPIIVENLKPYTADVDFELILVNNGSTDDTARVLMGLEKNSDGFLRVVTVENNIGYGHGIMSGLKAARADILAYTHADIQTPPADVIKAYQVLREKGYDPDKVLVKGYRINRSGDKAFFTRWLARVVEIMLGQKMEDINGQPKLFSRDLLERLSHPPLDFTFDVYVMFIAGLTERKLVTFDVDFGERIHGQSKWAAGFLSKYKTIFKYLINIFRIARNHYHAPHNTLKQAVRFLMTGVVTNVVNYSAFFVLLNFLSVYYLVSSVCGFMAGLVTGFFINRSWTFSAAEHNPRTQFMKFFIVNMVSLGMNMATILFFTEILSIIPEISQIFAIAVSTVINFTGSKLWAFKKAV
ncbi:GtrA family protein [Candidatus Margulisiibacteriota bacterium]